MASERDSATAGPSLDEKRAHGTGSDDMVISRNKNEKAVSESNGSSAEGKGVATNALEASQTTLSTPPAPAYQTRLSRLITPKPRRWDPANPPKLRLPTAFLYAICTTFTVANLYYCQPVLNKIAKEFNVTYEESAQVATLLQAGYAAGLVFVLPLGDMLKRRPFLISLVFFTATVWIGSCLTHNFTAFRIISFIAGITTVTPQLLIPLVGEYAPGHRKAFYMSIIVSGLLLGMLIARVLSGILANYTSWRNIYWFACGVQYLIGIILYIFMPDYPSTNTGLGYLKALWSILVLFVTEPLLVQASLIVFFLSAVFTSFWTTLTFLLASPPFSYSSLIIGLFALLGIVAIATVPLWSTFIDRYVSLVPILVAEFVVLACVATGTFIGTFTIAGPIIMAVGIDVGIQVVQVANRANIFSINPKARNRTNTAYMAFAFAGQLSGTAIGNRLYAAGGWRWSGSCSIGFIVAAMVVALVRGPHEKKWVGWRGGWGLKRDKAGAA